MAVSQQFASLVLWGTGLSDTIVEGWAAYYPTEADNLAFYQALKDGGYITPTYSESASENLWQRTRVSLSLMEFLATYGLDLQEPLDPPT